MNKTKEPDGGTKFYSDAIGVEVNGDHLKALDLEWILRKVRKASKNAFSELKDKEIPRVPMEVIISNRKKLIFVFLPQEIYDSLDDIFRLTTKTFSELTAYFKRARQRDNINQVIIERLRYDGNEFSVAQTERIIFNEEIKEKPLTEF